jgi:hypothetical protein
VIVTDALNGKIFLSGASISGYTWEFSRPINDTITSYVNADVTTRIFSLSVDGIPSSTPVLTLSINNGLTRRDNTASFQSGLYQITSTQTATLLGSSKAKRFSYAWWIQPLGYEPVRAPIGEGYDGTFVIVKEGYAGSTLKDIELLLLE